MAPAVKIPDHVTKEWCDGSLDYEAIPEFRKTALTRAIRMGAPFTVETSEGPLRCEDGWLCFDARGYPYPVAADEFELIYEPAAAGGQQDGSEVAVGPEAVYDRDGDCIVWQGENFLREDRVADPLQSEDTQALLWAAQAALARVMQLLPAGPENTEVDKALNHVEIVRRMLKDPAHAERPLAPAELHPATRALLGFFDYGHLPEELQAVSKPFGDLAYELAGDTELFGPELTVGLRKLLEAKDCIVRAAVTETEVP